MRLLQSKALRQGSISHVKRVFDRKTSKSREVRVHVVFPRASIAGTFYPVTVPHSLGHVPTSWTPVGVRRDQALGPAGIVFDKWPWATRTHVTFHCSAAGTRAEIILR